MTKLMINTVIQFECGACDYIGFAKKVYTDKVMDHLMCYECGETLTDLDALDEDDELPDFEFGAHEFDDDGYDHDAGELD